MATNARLRQLLVKATISSTGPKMGRWCPWMPHILLLQIEIDCWWRILLSISRVTSLWEQSTENLPLILMATECIFRKVTCNTRLLPTHGVSRRSNTTLSAVPTATSLRATVVGLICLVGARVVIITVPTVISLGQLVLSMVTITHTVATHSTCMTKLAKLIGVGTPS